MELKAMTTAAESDLVKRLRDCGFLALADRVKDLELERELTTASHNQLAVRVASLQASNAEMRTALEFYAEPQHWSAVDGFTPASPLSEYRPDMGDTARETLRRASASLETENRIEEQREVNDLLREFIWHKGLEREMLEWLLDKRGVSLAKRMTHADLYGPPVATKDG